MKWKDAKALEKWICDVCLGTCVCSRCTTRGPPRWFGHKKGSINKTPDDSEAVDSNGFNSDLFTSSRSAGPKPNLMNSCCHTCRNSVKSSGISFKKCATCSYVTCKNCFGNKVTQTWEEAEQTSTWSCAVCNGVCGCNRCRTRPLSWYGQNIPSKEGELKYGFSALHTSNNLTNNAQKEDELMREDLEFESLLPYSLDSSFTDSADSYVTNPSNPQEVLFDENSGQNFNVEDENNLKVEDYLMPETSEDNFVPAPIAIAIN